jgi:hypothetical protein
MRENRPSGSEGGATELNRSLLPLSKAAGPLQTTGISARLVAAKVGNARDPSANVTELSSLSYHP